MSTDPKAGLKQYGTELLVDLVACDPDTMTAESLEQFFSAACELTKMEKVKLHIWDDGYYPDDMPDHLVGISACQFIKTSSMVVHALTRLKEVYINIFSCSEFDTEPVYELTKIWFQGYGSCRTLCRGGIDSLMDA